METRIRDKNVTLSIVIPAYRFSRYIKECVDSVLNQVMDFPFEIIISDDFSCDGTKEILESNYLENPNVIILETDRNLGVYHNIKKLLDSAKGKYISYIDGDDYFTDPYKLKKQVDFLEGNPEFSMHSTGYRWVNESSIPIPPSDNGLWLVPLKNEITVDDMLEKNLVGYGRTFRNIPNILKSDYSDLIYLDWVISFELSMIGKIRCEEWCSGSYRISESGIFSKTSADKIDMQTKLVLDAINKEYSRRKMKLVSIIDCFVHDKKVETNLINSIPRIRKMGSDIYLVSNTAVDKSIVENVDYYFYDKRNQLFQKEYPGVMDVDFWNSTEGFVVHNIKPSFQKHGLSVLINLFNSLSICKSLGYTHFQRFETDDIFGPSSIEWIKKIPDEVHDKKAKGMFYLNKDNKPPDASFHYFFCEIDYFLSIMPNIKCEDDYQNYLINLQGNRNFRVVENYIYDNIVSNDLQGLIIRKDGETQMKHDFPDTTWNTVVSAINISEKYKGCVTEVYKKLDKDGNYQQMCLYSSNPTQTPISRKIIIHTTDLPLEIHHKLHTSGTWCINPIPENSIRIDVFQGDTLLYSQETLDIKSYIKDKN